MTAAGQIIKAMRAIIDRDRETLRAAEKELKTLEAASFKKVGEYTVLTPCGERDLYEIYISEDLREIRNVRNYDRSSMTTITDVWRY